MKGNLTQTDRALQLQRVHTDVVVAGAGVAGISVALAAARKGMRVVLINDRPILGGAASSEIRVGPGGATHSPFNRYARETGIIEEIFNHIQYKAQQTGTWTWPDFDEVYFDLVLQEKNIQLFLNTTIYRVNSDEEMNITSIEGIMLRAEKCIIFEGNLFVDCTGDGTVGYLAGADYRMGREGKEETQELYAPDEPDEGTMGASLLFTTMYKTSPVTYQAPSWAIKFDELPSFGRLQRSISKLPDGTICGFWWMEYGGQLHSIYDDDKVQLNLRRLVYGIWDYIKNSGDFSGVDNQAIDWIGYLPGKRESRRLMGDYVVTVHDFLQQRHFDDSIGYTGWPIDVHPPEGYRSLEEGCTHYYIPGITDIPMRALYSRNI